jgi:hypothetical protein
MMLSSRATPHREGDPGPMAAAAAISVRLVLMDPGAGAPGPRPGTPGRDGRR